MGLDETLIAVVERKAMDEFCNSLVDGTLGLAMGELAQLGTTAVVVERTYTATVTRRLCRWRLGLGYLLVRLQVRYPAVPVSAVVFLQKTWGSSE